MYMYKHACIYIYIRVFSRGTQSGWRSSRGRPHTLVCRRSVFVICAYVHVYIYIYIDLSLSLYIYTHIYMYMYVYMYICMYIFPFFYLHICMRIQLERRAVGARAEEDRTRQPTEGVGLFYILVRVNPQ